MTSPDQLAPVILFCYNRPEHLQQTIRHLQMNTLATQSELFIYADGPKDQDDERMVAHVRAQIAHITGFRTVTVIASEKNKGLAASVIEGVSDILTRYKCAIVLEDDMLSTSDFLSFMNEALQVYADRNDIFSVSGYTPPIAIPPDYTGDLYLAPRASSWGWGTWAHKWAKADWQVKDFEALKSDKAMQNKLCKGGEDLWPMLAKQQRGVIDSWAIRWTYTQFRNSAYGLYPVHSKIKNIGTDGSGTNFTFTTGYYGQEMSEGHVEMDPKLAPDEGVMHAFNRYYRMSFLVKIKNWIKYRI